LPKRLVEVELTRDHWAILTKGEWKEFVGKGQRFRLKETDEALQLGLKSGAFKEVEKPTE